MRETEFKQTEIGLIPSDWEVKTIGDFTNVVTGATPNTKISEFWGGNIRWMNSGELNLKRVHEVAGRITELGYESASTFMLPPYCVLIGLAGQGKTRGTAAINYVPLCTNQSIAAFTPNDKFDSFFLYFFMDSQYENLRRISSGDGGRGGLSKGLLEDYKVIFPPLAEQQRIAEVLSDFDELIDSLSALIAKKENIKHGAMQELLTARRRLPGFTDPWVELTVSNILVPIADKAYQIQTTEYESQGKYPVVDQGQQFIVAYCNDDNKICKEVNAGLIIFGDHTRIFKFIDFPFVVGADGVKLFRCHSQYFTKYIYYVCSMLKIPNTGYNRHSKYLKESIVTIPSEAKEQRAIATILSDMDSEISALKAERDKYLSLKQGAMQQLLCGKIRLV